MSFGPENKFNPEPRKTSIFLLGRNACMCKIISVNYTAGKLGDPINKNMRSGAKMINSLLYLCLVVLKMISSKY